MPVSLRTHADIARALQTLGVDLDAARKLEPAKAKDPALAAAVVEVLRGVDGKELKRLQALVGGGAAASSTEARPNAGAAPALVARLPTRDGGKAPRLDANLPQVAVLLQTYDVKKKADRPLERVLVHVAKIQELLSGEVDPKKLAEKAMSADLRRHVFLLEGIGKLYGRSFDEAVEVQTAAKELEDTLGLVSACRTNLAYARQVSAPVDVLRVLEKAERDATKNLQDLLADKWMPDEKGRIPAVKNLLKGWGRADWDDYAEDKKFVRKELVRRLEKLAETPYDMNNLQEGIHELRRQLRWFPIYAESVNGLVQLDAQKNPVAAYEPMLHQALATSKYLQLPDDSREVDAIRVSRSLYTALMQLTLDLGGLKDAGEPLEALWHAWMDCGRAKNLEEARVQVATHLGGDKGARLERDVHDNAHRLYAEMKKNRLVETLAEEVRKG